jgi:hypothetical protein
MKHDIQLSRCDKILSVFKSLYGSIYKTKGASFIFHLVQEAFLLLPVLPSFQFLSCLNKLPYKQPFLIVLIINIPLDNIGSIVC